MKKKGFTLIELIIVMGVLGALLPVMFGIFFIILQQQTRIYRLSQVKREGDFTLAVMEQAVQNVAYTARQKDSPTTYVSVCNSDSDSAHASSIDSLGNLYFDDALGNEFSYLLKTDTSGYSYIASTSAIPATSTPVTYQLSNNQVTFSNLTVSCTRSNEYSTPLVSISFTVSSYPVSARSIENVSMTYSTRVKLRTY